MKGTPHRIWPVEADKIFAKRKIANQRSLLMVGLNGNISFSTIMPHTYHMSKKYVHTINKWTRLLGNTVFARKKYWILQRKKLSISAYKRTVFIQLRKFEMFIYLHRKVLHDTFFHIIDNNSNVFKQSKSKDV